MLEWYDAFYKDPLYLGDSVSEDSVKEFCKTLGLGYERVESDK